MQAHDTNVFDDSYFAPSFNVAPQTMQPVVRLVYETGLKEPTVMRWAWCRSGCRWRIQEELLKFPKTRLFWQSYRFRELTLK